MRNINFRYILGSLIVASSFFFYDCGHENSKNKQTAEAVLLYAASASGDSCNSNDILASTEILSPEEVLPSGNPDCENPLFYSFDGRVFSSSLPREVNAKMESVTMNISHNEKQFDIPVRLVFFSTVDAINFDKKGYIQNRDLYDYSEYRATFTDSQGNYTGIYAVSENSISNAFTNAVEKCKKEGVR